MPAVANPHPRLPILPYITELHILAIYILYQRVKEGIKTTITVVDSAYKCDFGQYSVSSDQWSILPLLPILLGVPRGTKPNAVYRFMRNNLNIPELTEDSRSDSNWNYWFPCNLYCHRQQLDILLGLPLSCHIRKQRHSDPIASIIFSV